MDPDHDRQTRILVCLGRACDVEVQTLEFVLGEELLWELALNDAKQLALKADISQLRANWSAPVGLGVTVTCQTGAHAHPWVVALVWAG
jgi:hypothetical protein